MAAPAAAVASPVSSPTRHQRQGTGSGDMARRLILAQAGAREPGHAPQLDGPALLHERSAAHYRDQMAEAAPVELQGRHGSVRDMASRFDQRISSMQNVIVQANHNRVRSLPTSRALPGAAALGGPSSTPASRAASERFDYPDIPSPNGSVEAMSPSSGGGGGGGGGAGGAGAGGARGGAEHESNKVKEMAEMFQKKQEEVVGPEPNEKAKALRKDTLKDFKESTKNRAEGSVKAAAASFTGSSRQDTIEATLAHQRQQQLTDQQAKMMAEEACHHPQLEMDAFGMHVRQQEFARDLSTDQGKLRIVRKFVQARKARKEDVSREDVKTYLRQIGAEVLPRGASSASATGLRQQSSDYDALVNSILMEEQADVVYRPRDRSSLDRLSAANQSSFTDAPMRRPRFAPRATVAAPGSPDSETSNGVSAEATGSVDVEAEEAQLAEADASVPAEEAAAAAVVAAAAAATAERNEEDYDDDEQAVVVEDGDVDLALSGTAIPTVHEEPLKEEEEEEEEAAGDADGAEGDATQAEAAAPASAVEDVDAAAAPGDSAPAGVPSDEALLPPLNPLPFISPGPQMTLDMAPDAIRPGPDSTLAYCSPPFGSARTSAGSTRMSTGSALGVSEPADAIAGSETTAAARAADAEGPAAADVVVAAPAASLASLTSEADAAAGGVPAAAAAVAAAAAEEEKASDVATPREEFDDGGVVEAKESERAQEWVRSEEVYAAEDAELRLALAEAERKREDEKVCQNQAALEAAAAAAAADERRVAEAAEAQRQQQEQEQQQREEEAAVAVLLQEQQKVEAAAALMLQQQQEDEAAAALLLQQQEQQQQEEETAAALLLQQQEQQQQEQQQQEEEEAAAALLLQQQEEDEAAAASLSQQQEQREDLAAMAMHQQQQEDEAEEGPQERVEEVVAAETVVQEEAQEEATDEVARATAAPDGEVDDAAAAAEEESGEAAAEQAEDEVRVEAAGGEVNPEEASVAAGAVSGAEDVGTVEPALPLRADRTIYDEKGGQGNDCFLCNLCTMC